MGKLTGKELQALSEQLNSEAILVKKYRLYAQNMSDMQLKRQCEAIASRHEAHYAQLLQHLS